MEITHGDKKLMVAIVAQELADLDVNTIKWGEYRCYLLPQATRKLAYWLEQPVHEFFLDEAHDALVNLAKCADGSDLSFEFGEHINADERDTLRDSFDDEYETAVASIIGWK